MMRSLALRRLVHLRQVLKSLGFNYSEQEVEEAFAKFLACSGEKILNHCVCLCW